MDLVSRADLGKMLSLEEIKQLVGCPPADPRCVVQHGHVLGNAVLVWGTVGRVGDRAVISVAAVDIQAGSSLGRASRSVDADDGEEMIGATRQLATEMRVALGMKPPEKWKPVMAAMVRTGGFLSDYSGGQGSIDSWAWSFEVEVDIFLLEQLPLYVQVGLSLGHGEAEDQTGYTAYAFPAVVGLKYRFMRPWITPYLGLGIGLGFLSLRDTGGSFTLHALAGLEINPWERFGFLAEAGFNFSEYFDTTDKNYTQVGGKIHVGGIYRF